MAYNKNGNSLGECWPEEYNNRVIIKKTYNRRYFTWFQVIALNVRKKALSLKIRQSIKQKKVVLWPRALVQNAAQQFAVSCRR